MKFLQMPKKNSLKTFSAKKFHLASHGPEKIGTIAKIFSYTGLRQQVGFEGLVVVVEVLGPVGGAAPAGRGGS